MNRWILNVSFAISFSIYCGDFRKSEYHRCVQNNPSSTDNRCEADGILCSVDTLLRLEPRNCHRLGGHANPFRFEIRERVFEPVDVVSRGEILAIMAAAAFFARQSARDDQ